MILLSRNITNSQTFILYYTKNFAQVTILTKPEILNCNNKRRLQLNQFFNILQV